MKSLIAGIVVLASLAVGARGQTPGPNAAVKTTTVPLDRLRQKLLNSRVEELSGRAEMVLRSSLFIPVFAGNIILRHLMRANLFLVSVTSVFHPHYCVGLERVSFL